MEEGPEQRGEWELGNPDPDRQSTPETLALELGRASVLLENEAPALAWGAQLPLVLCRRPAGPRQNPRVAEVSQVETSNSKRKYLGCLNEGHLCLLSGAALPLRCTALM